MPCIAIVKPAHAVCAAVRPGTRSGVKVSDLLALPVEAGAAIRRRRLFHPVGVLARGRLERIAPPGQGLPIETGDVVGRVSKAVGLPGSVPDIAGLAWRMTPGSRPWDVLLATTALNRFLLLPTTSWDDTTYSSLMPFRYEGGVWWLRARLITKFGRRGLSLDTVADQLSRGDLEYSVDQAAGTGGFGPLARLTLSEVIPPDRDLSFDPTLNTAQGVTLTPGWLTNFRRAAYRRSREGRDAE
ncbi:phosphodiesterase [Mycolicibacterium baixiangningiae]|uniref:phosphodiesterase n=1 Tax=Mycolicibacterium baixiangningiae TaxID=2761578 RepID=UPI0018D0EED6|nr:phosphodiesterase [Mycolicibacterium baixiangningiae]